VCSKCGTSSTPEWRRSPEGSTTLCNACGLKEKKRAKNSIVPSQNYGPNKFHHSSFSQTANNSKMNSTISSRVAPQTNANYNYSYQTTSTQVRAHPYYRSQDAGPNYNNNQRQISIQPPSNSNLGYYPPVAAEFQQPYFFNGNHNANSAHSSQDYSDVECSIFGCPHCPSVNNYCDMAVAVAVPLYQQSHV